MVRERRLRPRRVIVDKYENDSESRESSSSDSSESQDQYIDPGAEQSVLAYYLNKLLLFVPIATTTIFRSIGDPGFRAVAISWAVILPLTSDISMDEAVFPALVASTLGFDNSVVSRNMYISISRSRLGLLALLVLSVYTSDYHILCCGMLLRLIVAILTHLLQNSIPIAEVTLISGAFVNVIYHFIGHAFSGSINDSITMIASGLAAAIPCYPLFMAFVAKFRKTRGRFYQWPLATLIYVVYFSTAIYLYFFFFGIEVAQILEELKNNADLVLYWASCLVAAFAAAGALGHLVGLDGRRKLWHLCSVTMFLPSWVRARTFTKLALAAALVLFCALETVRATCLPPFGQPIHRALQQFVDHRDQRGPVVISHLYLLLGISVPIFLAQSPAGLVCLGLGDTFASQIGKRWGYLRIFGHKSIEGCLAFAVAAFLALKFTTDTHQIWLVVLPTALLEAVSPINDNLIVPMYMLSLQALLAENSSDVRTWGFIN